MRACFKIRSGPAARGIPARVWGLLLLAALSGGCATQHFDSAPSAGRPFAIQQDGFAYANELMWEYRYDPATGKLTHHRPQKPPDYTHHCFVVARSARQFFEHARFDPDLPVAEVATYRRLIRRVVSISPRRILPEDQRIIIPGYSNLFAFSQAREQLLKKECGSAVQSYFQRGHWRMIFPLSRHHQEKMARQLVAALQHDRPPLVHLVRFPQLTINHAVLLFGVKETGQEIQFATYDPNCPAEPTELVYDRGLRTFKFPRGFYFEGGRVDVYEIYHAWNY